MSTYAPLTRGLIITAVDVPTIPAGTSVDNLAAYYNSGAAPITVQGSSIASGAHAVWAWVSSAWVLLSSGTTTPPVDPGDTVVTPTAPTSDDANNTYTIPTTTGVDYKIGGVTTAAGTYSVGNVTTSVTILAVAQTGYALSGTESWTFNFTVTASYVTVLNDTFTAADGTDLNGRTTSDGLATWTLAAGTGGARIMGNRAAGPATGPTTGSYIATRNTAPATTKVQSVRITCDWQTTGAGCSIVFRVYSTTGAQITNVTLALTWGGGISMTSLYSTTSALAGSTTGWGNSGTVTITITGTLITVTNGTLTATSTLTGYPVSPSYIQIGMQTNLTVSQTTYYDNLKVEVMP